MNKIEVKLAEVIKATDDLVFKYNDKKNKIFNDLCEHEESLICSFLDDVTRTIHKINCFIDTKVEKLEGVNIRPGLYETQVKSGDQPWEHWMYLPTIEAARKNLALLTDTPYRINVRIFKNGCLLEESGCNYFYSASESFINEYVSGKSNPFEKKDLNNGN